MDRNQIISAIKVGEVFQNPGGGTSTIVSITDKYIYYQRKGSKIPLPIDILLSVYENFKGKKCTTSDLKAFMPKVFSSLGHSCNCTFLFLLAEKLGLIKSGILGKGTRGNVFYVEFL